ncbi:MAG: heme biosynthesis protein HemY [Cycloclasticus sp.]|nr:MAG: heme biosynthesis protein HemY [Cycloclasticus sp.]
MKLILIIIAALVIASGLAYQVHIDPGYVQLTYGQWLVETSLAVLLFITAVFFIGFYIALRTLLTIKRTPKIINQWNQRRKQIRSKKELNKGIIDSAEGNWQRSEKLLVKHAQQSDTPLLNYLSAAHAAQSQEAYGRRDDYLFKAGEALPDQIHAIHLTRAKLQLSAGQLEQALATLQELKSATPNQPIVLTLLLKTFAQLKDWNSLYTLLPSVKNNRKIFPENWQSIEHDTLVQLFEHPAGGQNIDTVWKSLDKRQKLNTDYLTPYAMHLIAIGKSQIAEDLLLKSLNAQLNAQLLKIYSELNISTNKKIKQIEKWGKNQSMNPVLLNTLGRLCLEQKLWGKAETYLTQSISIKPTSSAYFLLGNLHEKQGAPSGEINTYYKDGLAISENATSINALSDLGISA